MLLLYTNQKRDNAKRFASLCVISSMVVSSYCFPLDISQFIKENENNRVSENAEIDRFASDCVITIARATESNTTDNPSTKESDADEKGKNDDSVNETTSTEETPDEPVEDFNYQFDSEAVVTKIAFEKTDTIKTREDDKALTGHIKVNYKDIEDFDLSGVKFISEDPTIAKIEYDYCRGLENLYYKLTPVSGGETQIYAQTDDGTICSEHIKVVVKKNEVESIDLEKSVTMKLGESKDLEYILTPESPRNKTLTWTSSDESVVTVSAIGTIKAVDYGKATITATSSNGISASCSVVVSIKEREMNLRYDAYVEDSNHVGNEWYHNIKINGKEKDEYGEETVTLKVGDKLTFDCKSVEDDSVPDVGSKTVKHTVTESDLINGFTVKADVYVKENRGRYSGKKAHVVYEFVYTPAD